MAVARLGVEVRGGAFLDQLLVAALHRAVALPEVDHVAVLVGQHLHLDVPRVLDVFLQVDVGVAEGGLGLGLGLLQGRLQGQVVHGHAHAAAAAAGRGLDQHRKAESRWANCTRLGLALDQARRCRARWARSASRAICRAVFLSPSRAIASGEGPMNSMLQLRQTSAKWAFSARKP